MFTRKKNFSLLILMVAFVSIIPLAAWGAASDKQDVYIEEGRLVDENFIRVGNVINVLGAVNGDAILVGNTINIQGQILGDVIAIGRTINISGDIAGNIRVAGNSIKIGGRIARNANIFGGQVLIDEKASIGKDLLVFGGNIEINGKVSRNVSGRTIGAIISGEVGGNVNLEASRSLTLASGSVIKENLYYSSFQKIKIQDGAWIKEKIVYKAPPLFLENFTKFSFLMGKLISLLGLLVSGLIMIILFNKKILAVTRQMLQKPFSSILWGLIGFILVPVALFLLILSLVGIPLALIGFSAYLIIVYVAKVFISIAIGQKLLKIGWVENRIFGKKETENKEKIAGIPVLIKVMIPGVIIFMLLISLPIVGRLLYLVGVWWMLGGLISAARNKIKNK